MELRSKTINSVIWSLLGNFTNQGVSFVIGIILARILSPGDFGLIGMITVFITLGEMFVNSGFNQALVRRKDCTEVDYATVFYFNLVVSLLLYFLLFLFSPLIARFFKQSELINILKVLGLGIIVNSFGLIQRVKITRELNFKYLNLVLSSTNIVSGLIAVYLASTGWGVWSLVFKNLIRDILTVFLFWFKTRWKPLLAFSKQAFRELFSFGSRLLLSGIFGTLVNNIQYIIIGRSYSPVDLGFYTRAELFRNLPSLNIESAITSVGYPVLSKVQHDKEQLNAGFRKILNACIFIISLTMIAVMALSDSIVLSLVGEKWLPSAFYLKLLGLNGILFPLLSININLVNVMGRSDIYFKWQLISQILAIPIVIICSFWGIWAMILGFTLNAINSYIMYTRASSAFTNYHLKEQLGKLLPVLLLMTGAWLPSYFLGVVLQMHPAIELLLQGICGMTLTILFSEWVSQPEYLYFKSILLAKIRKQ